MKEGKIKFFDYSKGFGFISPADLTEDIFVHKTGLIDTVKEEDLVTFEVVNGKKGGNAINVKVIDER